MLKPIRSVMRLLTVSLLAVLPVSLMAQAPAGNLMEVWSFTVKDGHQADFEAAFLQQGALREQHGDPRSWEVYMPETGTELNRYLVRACCFAWADQDSYAAWTTQTPSLMQQWSSEVNQHIEATSHYFYEVDAANSHWPEGGNAPAKTGVTEFSIAAGKVSQFHEARSELSQIALNQGWSDGGRHWFWLDRIGGQPTAVLVIPFANYAAMAPGEQSIAGFLTDHMGADKAAALMEKLVSSVSSSSYTIWMHRPDLSSRKD
ncbi:MAG TPA: hypothetical protein VFG52_02840 [Xanthomonadales bacterium]|nr:hypothetical protein [Xanthomonadales bacterium]